MQMVIHVYALFFNKHSETISCLRQYWSFPLHIEVLLTAPKAYMRRIYVYACGTVATTCSIKCVCGPIYIVWVACMKLSIIALLLLNCPCLQLALRYSLSLQYLQKYCLWRREGVHQSTVPSTMHLPSHQVMDYSLVCVN